MLKFNLLKQYINKIRHCRQSDKSGYNVLYSFGKLARKLSFTMAEILLSLTIIGVVAAITLPSLTGNINERTWNTQRKALYARMSQAIALMGSLNGYGIGATESETASNAAKAFITNGLAKVYKINNICDNEHLGDCGIPDKITKYGTNSKIDIPKTLVALNSHFNINWSGIVSYSQINTKAAAFETQNGESILIFYNPNCTFIRGVNSQDNNHQNLMQPTMCANFIYDLNGKKGPNALGKDMGFMTVFYPTDSYIAAPNSMLQAYVNKDDAHPNFSIGYGNKTCRDNYGANARMANIEELKSIFVNNNLGYSRYVTNGTFLEGTSYFSSTSVADSKVYALVAYSGAVLSLNLAYGLNNGTRAVVFCIK